jgi:hypothetical protein
MLFISQIESILLFKLFILVLSESYSLYVSKLSLLFIDFYMFN